MEQYDVLIVGNDIGSLSAALFLARKMRKVAVLHDAGALNVKKDVEDITDAENQKYVFKRRPSGAVSGLEKGALLCRYLEQIGMESEIKALPCPSDAVIGLDGAVASRMMTPDQFKVYLVRHYPKQRDQIHRFFQDMDRLYRNFVEQQEYMLHNQDYTLTSLMIEWGDYSLKQVLGKYFSDTALIEEFGLFDAVSGLDLAEVNCYNFFMNFFIGLYHGFAYAFPSEVEIMKMLLAKIALINPKFVQNRKIARYVSDSNGKILFAVDSANKEISAKYYVVAGNPKEFYSRFFPDRPAELAEILRYYPNLEGKKRIQSLYVALSQKPASAGISELVYQFKNRPEDPVKVTRLFQYKAFDPDSCGAKNGTISLDVVYDEGSEVSVQRVLDRAIEAFPKLGKMIVGTALGKPRPFYSMLAVPEVRKGLSINEQIAIEAGEHIQVFDNLWLIGEWLRPEAGLFGQFHAGIIDGDAIEERLYYGEDDDAFFYLTNDEIMMMMRHNYGKKPLGPTENHINFHIGKSHYFIRTKGKNITLHRGEYAAPDLTIYSTNDKLSNLLMKKATFDEVLKSGGFKYKGKEEDLYAAINAFGLDDYHEYDNSYQPKGKIYFLGVKFLFAHLLVWSAMALLSNFYPMIWLAPFAEGLTLVLTLVKFRIFRKIGWFEWFLNATGIGILLLSIFSPAFNHMYRDDVVLGILALVFFVSWIVNRPIVHNFHQFDYRTDYSQSALFKVINNGLTLVWALIFGLILGFTYVTGERYVTVMYNFVFLGIFLTYFYPVMYITTNIKD